MTGFRGWSATLLVLCFAGALSGCGQTGPLFLPEDPQAAPAGQGTAATSTDDAQSETEEDNDD